MESNGKPINLDFRPDGYWDPEELLKNPFLNVKGTARRNIIGKAIKDGDSDRLSEELIANALEPEARETWGAIHPSMMGGEYLPDYLPGEVEIARIELASVTSDVISVRARPEKSRIMYRIVDEYGGENEGEITTVIDDSEQPLTLWALIELIETAEWYGNYTGLVLGLADFNSWHGQCWSTMRGFFKVSSAYYDEIGAYYDYELYKWTLGQSVDITDIDHAI